MTTVDDPVSVLEDEEEDENCFGWETMVDALGDSSIGHGAGGDAKEKLRK